QLSETEPIMDLQSISVASNPDADTQSHVCSTSGDSSAIPTDVAVKEVICIPYSVYVPLTPSTPPTTSKKKISSLPALNFSEPDENLPDFSSAITNPFEPHSTGAPEPDNELVRNPNPEDPCYSYQTPCVSPAASSVPRSSNATSDKGS